MFILTHDWVSVTNNDIKRHNMSLIMDILFYLKKTEKIGCSEGCPNSTNHDFLETTDDIGIDEKFP